MTPVTQSILDARLDWREAGTRPGDCLRAAIASLLDRDLESVPHFAESLDPHPGWMRDLRQWMHDEYGADWSFVGTDDPDFADALAALCADGVRYVLASGPSPRGPWRHSVVWDLTEDRLAHDPHPSGAGLAAEPDEYDWPSVPWLPEPQEWYEQYEAEPEKAAG